MNTTDTFPSFNDTERKKICAKLEWEGGLEYLLTGAAFPEIRDERFHLLREVYVSAAKALEEYLRYEEYLEEEYPLTPGEED